MAETPNILGREVVVSLRGLQQAEDGEEVQMLCPGEYHFRDGRHYITYNETTDENGQAPDTRCILKISADEIEIIKRGGVSTHLFFAPGKPHMSVYTTPYGDITVETTVTSL